MIISDLKNKSVSDEKAIGENFIEGTIILKRKKKN